MVLQKDHFLLLVDGDLRRRGAGINDQNACICSHIFFIFLVSVDIFLLTSGEERWSYVI